MNSDNQILSRSPFFSYAIVVAVLACAVAGCSKSDKSRRAEVSGTVMLDGKLVESGAITFVPTGGNSGPTAGATILNGKYTIDQRGGPPLGDCLVQFSGARKTGRRIPDKFGDTLEDEYIEIFPPSMNVESKIVRKLEPGVNKLDFDLKSTE